MLWDRIADRIGYSRGPTCSTGDDGNHAQDEASNDHATQQADKPDRNFTVSQLVQW